MKQIITIGQAVAIVLLVIEYVIMVSISIIVIAKFIKGI